MTGEILFRNAPVHFSDKGKGRVIVLLHGFLESLEIFDEFSNALAKNFRVVSIDLPGHGKSDCIGYVHSMELMAESVKAVMDHLNLRKYILVGHSMGGYVALAFAELYPDNLKGLCLLHSTAWGDTPEKKKERTRTINLVKRDHSTFVKALVNKLYAPANRPRLAKEIRKHRSIAKKVSKRAIIASLEGMKERVNRELLLRFAPFPVLFIVGKKDSVIPWETMIAQAESPQRSRMLLLDNTGHMGFLEAKKETLDELGRFSARCFRGSF
jgi:pimeloyl-ACP methyl ester carboxylesterase